MSNGAESTRYAYWSERSVRQVAADRDLNLAGNGRTKITGVKVPFVDLKLDLERGPRDPSRKDITQRLERAIGEEAVEDFVTAPVARFAKGVSRVEFSHFMCAEHGRVVISTHILSSDGTRVGFALFGSSDNLRGWTGRNDPQPGGWTSSSMWSVLAWINSRCTATPWDDDPEYLAVEALKIADKQGTNRDHDEHPDDPWRRGFTFADAEAEWFAEVHFDVVLDKDRWLDDFGVDRIVVGAPLWIRTPTDGFRRYRDHRGLENDPWVRRWHSRRQR